MAELADTRDLGSRATGRVGSSPTIRTIYSHSIIGRARRLKSTMGMGSNPIGSTIGCCEAQLISSQCSSSLMAKASVLSRISRFKSLDELISEVFDYDFA